MTYSSCKDCEKRRVGCHSECEDYLNWLEIHKKEVEQIRQEKEKEHGGLHTYSQKAKIEKEMAKKWRK